MNYWDDGDDEEPDCSGYEDQYWADGTPIPEDPEWTAPALPDPLRFVTVHLLPTFPAPQLGYAVPCLPGKPAQVSMRFLIRPIDGSVPYEASINVKVSAH